MRAALICVLAASTGFAQDALEQRRDDIASKLESLRGLKFKHPLPIRKGTRREYAFYVLGNAERVYGKDLNAAEKGMKALGLIPRLLKLKLALTMPVGPAPKAFWSGKDLLLLDPKAPDDWILNKMTRNSR